MRVLFHDEMPVRPEIVAELGAEPVTAERLLRESDFVSIHVPLTPGTRRMIDAAALEMMKPTAILVNTARGPVVDEAALADALRKGTIAAVGLDVFETEPHVHPALLELPNAVLTPHIASASVATRRRMSTMAAENVVEALNGRRPPNLINAELWKEGEGAGAAR